MVAGHYSHSSHGLSDGVCGCLDGVWMGHFWDCLINAPGGCSDLLWVQDIYDWVTGVICLGVIVGMPVWIAQNEGPVRGF